MKKKKISFKENPQIQMLSTIVLAARKVPKVPT